MAWTEEQYSQLLSSQAKKGAAAAASVPAASKKKSSTAKLQALGRLKAGKMNKTEARFAQYLDLLLHSGQVLWWKFEGIKLILAANTSLTVDFAVLPADGVLQMIDVKGSKAIFTDDARAKMKIAAEMFPFVFKAVYPEPKKAGAGWVFEVF